MKAAGFVMDHTAAHGNGVTQHLIGNTELFERVNAAGRKREIDRASANCVSLARITASLVELDLVSLPAEISRQ